MDIFLLISGSGRGIIVEKPDSRSISVMDGIIVDFDIIHNTYTLFDLNARPTCTPMIERVYHVIVKFYFIRVPYSKSAVSSAGYSTSPTGSENHLSPLRFQTFNRKVF